MDIMTSLALHPPNAVPGRWVRITMNSKGSVSVGHYHNDWSCVRLQQSQRVDTRRDAEATMILPVDLSFAPYLSPCSSCAKAAR